MSQHVPPVVEMFRISKTYPGVRALSEVDFTLLPGEVHVLFGENGAGKSTLISILSGVTQPTSGQMTLGGHEISFSSVTAAKAQGVYAVYQEFSLIPTLTVAENIFLGNEPMRGPFIDRGAIFRKAEALFQELGFKVPVRRRVSQLSRAEQQMVEIAKAFHGKARVLILDEPTASLTESEVETLFRIISDAKARGVGIVYISHRIQEFARIADRITILRDGRLIRTVDAAGITESALVELMTGRAIEEIYPKIARKRSATPMLVVKGLIASGVQGVDMDVHAGEVLGVAGLVGSGKSRFWRTILGLQPLKAGSITLNGRTITRLSPRDMLRQGIFYLPPDRKTEGLQMAATSSENIRFAALENPDLVASGGFLRLKSLARAVRAVGERVDLNPAYMGRTVSKLSGGNQQKVLFGKGFVRDAAIYIFDEPTVGVDMGTRAALYRLIRDLAESGKAVVVISSDLPEVMNLSHRLVVFCNGRVSARLEGPDLSEDVVLKAFFSQEPVAG